MMKAKPFEKSKFDKEAKGMKEGSPKDMAKDKKQMPAFMKAAKKQTAKQTVPAMPTSMKKGKR